MITEHMTLTTRDDARTWAAQMGDDLTDEQVQRLADWIWSNKPSVGCGHLEHPLCTLSDEQFWGILDGTESADAR